MALTHCEPWTLLNPVQVEISRAFDSCPGRRDQYRQATASDWVPAVDIREEDVRFVIHADLPGVDPAAIEVSMEDGVLSISGERGTVGEQRRRDFRRAERARGRFLRRFRLPDGADADGIGATSRHGVLEIVIPKQHKLQPRRIEVAA